MQSNNIISVLTNAAAGIVIGEVAGTLAKEDKVIRIPFFILYALCFTAIYTVGAVFFVLVYLAKGFFVPWLGLAVAVMAMSFSVVAVLFVLNQLKRLKNKSKQKTQVSKVEVGDKPSWATASTSMIFQEILRAMMGKGRTFSVPFFVVYAFCFTVVYKAGFLLWLALLGAGQALLWWWLTAVTMTVSVSSALLVTFSDKFDDFSRR